MVISNNPQPEKDKFQFLLDSTLSELNRQAKSMSQKIEQLKGNKLEPYVCDLMTELAVGTPFENSIEWVGGQKFPDIIAKKIYGIEIKTTTQNHWRTTGNSALESTRIKDVERIYMLFGKLGAPIEFKCRPYEECLSEVVVTHSPRYLIDMNLEQGKTIFDKMAIPYDHLRDSDNPIRPITDYYRGKLKPGQELWWIDQDYDKSSSMVIDIWTNLAPEKKAEIKTKAMVYFPEVFSNRGDKFSRLAVWMVTSEAIVCPNIRDPFTAGGKEVFEINGEIYRDIPQIFSRMFRDINNIIDLLLKTPLTTLEEFWHKKTNDEDRIKDWIELVAFNGQKVSGTRHLDLRKIIWTLIDQKI